MPDIPALIFALFWVAVIALAVRWSVIHNKEDKQRQMRGTNIMDVPIPDGAVIDIEITVLDAREHPVLARIWDNPSDKVFDDDAGDVNG